MNNVCNICFSYCCICCMLVNDRYNYYKKPKNLENRLQSIVNYIRKLRAEIKRRQIQNICKEKF